jgi:hypothetical protein
VLLVQPETLERAQRRLDEAARRHADPAVLETTVERAREALEVLAERTAELETAVPERLGAAIRDSMRAETLPVGRHVAEVRGLAGQTIRRLERLQLDTEAERHARVEDLGVLVELVTSGWRGVERRLDRLERAIDRLERTLDDRPVADVYRLDDRQERASGA